MEPQLKRLISMGIVAFEERAAVRPWTAMFENERG